MIKRYKKLTKIGYSLRDLPSNSLPRFYGAQCILWTLHSVLTFDECELRDVAVDLVGNSESVLVEVARFHFTDEQTELEVSTAD